jgi:pimeloyl-ACP methyl ester carboxylesterase
MSFLRRYILLWSLVWLAPVAAADCTIRTGAVYFEDGTVHYREAGAGPAVVLLHGLFAQKEQWDALLCELAASGRRALAPDLPGYGESRDFPLAVYPLEFQAERLHTLILELGLERLDLAGNSMGGTIAAEYAARYPDRVRTLAFIGAPLGAADWSEGVQSAIRAGINPFIPLDRDQFELEMRLLFAAPPEIPESIVETAVAEYRERQLHYRQVWDIVNLDADLLQIRHDERPHHNPPPPPTLILWGERDGIFAVTAAQPFQAHRPRSRLEILPETGHLPMLEHPAETAAAYRRFLDAPEPAGRDRHRGPGG